MELSRSHNGHRGRGVVRSFIVCASLSYRALFNWATPPLYTGSVLLPPLFQLIFFVLLGRTLNVADDEYFVIGNAVLACSVSGIFGGTMAIANERMFGTLPYMLLSSQRRITTLATRGLPYVLNGLAASTFVVVCVTPVIDLDWTWSAALGLGSAILIASASSTALGLCLGSAGLRFADVWLVGNLMATLMILVTGVNIPLDDLPSGLANFGRILPVTHAVAGAREAFAGNLGAAASSLLIELLIAVVYLALAWTLLRVFERSTRRSAKTDVL